jgi:hypothetical protein
VYFDERIFLWKYTNKRAFFIIFLELLNDHNVMLNVLTHDDRKGEFTERFSYFHPNVGVSVCVSIWFIYAHGERK